MCLIFKYFFIFFFICKHEKSSQVKSMRRLCVCFFQYWLRFQCCLNIYTWSHYNTFLHIFFWFLCWLEAWAYISQFHLIVVASEMCEKWNKKFQKLRAESDFCYSEKWGKKSKSFMFLYINNVSCSGEEAITIGNKIKTAIPNRMLT